MLYVPSAFAGTRNAHGGERIACCMDDETIPVKRQSLLTVKNSTGKGSFSKLHTVLVHIATVFCLFVIFLCEQKEKYTGTHLPRRTLLGTSNISAAAATASPDSSFEIIYPFFHTRQHLSSAGYSSYRECIPSTLLVQSTDNRPRFSAASITLNSNCSATIVLCTDYQLSCQAGVICHTQQLESPIMASPPPSPFGSSKGKIPTGVSFAIAGASGISAWMFVHPVDVVKVCLLFVSCSLLLASSLYPTMKA